MRIPEGLPHSIWRRFDEPERSRTGIDEHMSSAAAVPVVDDYRARDSREARLRRRRVNSENSHERTASIALQPLRPVSGRRVKRRWEQRTAEQVLAPLAECAAELLATGELSLVRRCENEQCVLWFYDRTRSHHRRWCNMATCGNRHKVAAFRERRQRRGSTGRIG